MPYQEGDTSPPHINVHNEVVPQVQALANEMGVDVDLPPVRGLGDSGHVDDHNLIHTALDKIAAEGSAGASWAQVINAPDAVTSSYYDDKGGQWQYYEWNAAGTFDVELSGGLVWALVVSGGCGGWDTNTSGPDQGQAGLVTEGLWEFQPGTHTVTVGKAGEANWSTNKETKKPGPSSVGDYGTQGIPTWGAWNNGRGAITDADATGYKSSITGDELEYAPGNSGPKRPGRAGRTNHLAAEPGTVIIATRIDVPTLPPAPPRLEVAPVVAAPVSISGPAVQEWLVRDKQGNRKVVYFLPGNTGAARSLALTEEGAEALAARRDLLDAIATTDVPDEFEGDPVTLLPKKLRGELTGFVEVRVSAQDEAVYSVTLGAGVLPGVMVAAGGPGGVDPSGQLGGAGGGAGGVIGQGAHVPVILPVQGAATYTVKVASTSPGRSGMWQRIPQHTTIAVQGQEPFIAAIGGGIGASRYGSGSNVPVGNGGSGGGGHSGMNESGEGGGCVPGQGNRGGLDTTQYGGGGGGYSAPGETGATGTGGAGFDLATALNLDANDGITGSFLNQVSVDGRIAGGGGGVKSKDSAGIDGGGTYNTSGGGSAMDYTGAGGGGCNAGTSGSGGAGAVYIITDPPS